MLVWYLVILFYASRCLLRSRKEEEPKAPLRFVQTWMTLHVIQRFCQWMKSFCLLVKTCNIRPFDYLEGHASY